jgi:hypothetical protein
MKSSLKREIQEIIRIMILESKKQRHTYIQKTSLIPLGRTLTFLPDLSFPTLYLCKRIMPHIIFNTCLLFFVQARKI